MFERSSLFELGKTFDCTAVDLCNVAIKRALGQAGAGWWECSLPSNALTWTTGVYDLFGLSPSTLVRREQVVPLYSEASRAVMERLRHHAISAGQAFIVDAQIRPADGGVERSMRLIGAPLIEQGKTVGLCGLKLKL